MKTLSELFKAQGELTEEQKAEFFTNLTEETKQVPFTMKNIYKMMEIVVGTHGSRMERALVEIFDKLTMHHDENRFNVEGWKTNSHYLVNQKFILEYIATPEWGKCRVIYGRGNAEKVDDLVKALCWLTGQNYSQHSTLYSFYQMTDREFGTWYEWGFFKVKVFKKGTLHAQFLDKKVWELFNRAVAKAKGFPLPESVKL